MRALLRPAGLLVGHPWNVFIEYATHHPYLAGAAVVFGGVVIVYEMRVRSETQASVSPQDMARLMNQGALLTTCVRRSNIRPVTLSGARQMNGDQILQAAETLKKYKEKTVSCTTIQDRWASAARQLAAQGFTKAFNLPRRAQPWRTETCRCPAG